MIINARIIVNADDFGYSESLNKAIIAAFNKNMISTTTMMCNMPGFDDACEIVHQEKLFDNIGIHFNISEGDPLTEPLKSFPRFFNNGKMYKSFKGHLLTKYEESALQMELQAQLDKLKKSGIVPTHCDSHHHTHHSWGIGKIVNSIALKNNIPAVRMRFNYGNISLQRKFFSSIYNLRLKRRSLAKTNYFCEIRSVTPELLSKNTIVEVMVHPVLNSRGELTNYINGSHLDVLMQKHLPINCFINYRFA